VKFKENLLIIIKYKKIVLKKSINRQLFQEIK